MGVVAPVPLIRGHHALGVVRLVLVLVRAILDVVMDFTTQEKLAIWGMLIMVTHMVAPLHAPLIMGHLALGVVRLVLVLLRAILGVVMDIMTQEKHAIWGMHIMAKDMGVVAHAQLVVGHHALGVVRLVLVLVRAILGVVMDIMTQEKLAIWGMHIMAKDMVVVVHAQLVVEHHALGVIIIVLV